MKSWAIRTPPFSSFSLKYAFIKGEKQGGRRAARLVEEFKDLGEELENRRSSIRKKVSR